MTTPERPKTRAQRLSLQVPATASVTSTESHATSRAELRKLAKEAAAVTPAVPTVQKMKNFISYAAGKFVRASIYTFWAVFALSIPVAALAVFALLCEYGGLPAGGLFAGALFVLWIWLNRQKNSEGWPPEPTDATPKETPTGSLQKTESQPDTLKS